MENIVESKMVVVEPQSTIESSLDFGSVRVTAPVPTGTVPTKVNLLGTLKTAPVSDYNSSNQVLLDDLRDDILFLQADTHNCMGDL